MITDEEIENVFSEAIETLFIPEFRGAAQAWLNKAAVSIEVLRQFDPDLPDRLMVDTTKEAEDDEAEKEKGLREFGEKIKNSITRREV